MNPILPKSFTTLSALPQDAIALFKNGTLAVLTNADSAAYDLSTGQALSYTEDNGSIQYCEKAEAMLDALSNAACALAGF